jgi:hypothetical protein
MADVDERDLANQIAAVSARHKGYFSSFNSFRRAPDDISGSQIALSGLFSTRAREIDDLITVQFQFLQLWSCGLGNTCKNIRLH